MRLLICLVGAQGDSVGRALHLGRQLRGRGHELTFLGEFSPAIEAEVAALGGACTRQASPEAFDAAVMMSLGAPDRLAGLARKLPSVLLVQECLLEVMALKGDFVHWVSLFRAATRVVFHSEHQRDKVFGSFISGLDASRMLVLPGGADPSTAAPRQNPPKDYFGVVMAGIAGSHRRVADVVAAGERLRDHNLLFTFIGDERAAASWPEGTRKVVQRNPGRYVVTGAQTPAQTLALIRRNDLLVQAAVDDAWPQALLDAAATGLPLLLSDIEPFSRHWTNGINCLKFPLERPDFLASLLRMVLHDDVLRNNLAANGQATVGKFPAERHLAQTMQLVESLKK
jgi:glycosyltransferase involved in cell wall biosynthesis